jgi:hypothetical protein
MAWWDSPLERRSIQSWMRVWTVDGARLGWVRFSSSDTLYVRPRRLSRRLFGVPLASVARVTGKGVYVTRMRSELRELARDELPHDAPMRVLPLAEPDRAPAGRVHRNAAGGRDL